MAFTTDTDSNYGSPPYREAAQRSQYRLSLQDRLLAALSGLGSVQPGANFGQSFLQAAGGTARATWAAKQAAMNYAQRQYDQETARQNAETQRMLAERAINAPPEKPAKPEKLVQIAGPDGAPVYVRESDAVGKPAYVKPDKPAKPATPKAEPLVKVAGPDGQTIYVPKSQAVGKSPPIKPPTAQQLRSSGALSRASDLDSSAADIESSLTKTDLFRLKTPYMMQTLKEKKYTNARKGFTETVLREFSGSAINRDEYDKYDQIFFAQPGDDKDTLAQKRQLRAGILSQLRSMSGQQALNEGLNGLAARVDALKKSQAPRGFDAEAAARKYGLE